MPAVQVLRLGQLPISGSYTHTSAASRDDSRSVQLLWQRKTPHCLHRLRGNHQVCLALRVHVERGYKPAQRLPTPRFLCKGYHPEAPRLRKSLGNPLPQTGASLHHATGTQAKSLPRFFCQFRLFPTLCAAIGQHYPLGGSALFFGQVLGH